MKLVLKVEVGRGKERVNSTTVSTFNGFTGTFDISAPGARQTRNYWSPDLLRYSTHGLGIVLRRDRKTSLQHIHTERLELTSQPKLLWSIHRKAGCLFSVTKVSVRSAQSEPLVLVPKTRKW